MMAEIEINQPGNGMTVTLDGGKEVGFDWAGKSYDDAVDNAKCSYGDPSKGIMIAKHDNRYWSADGVDPETGKLYTQAILDELVAIGVLDELFILP